MDKIVFDQEQLMAAVSQGARTILLCDNGFEIPLIPNVCYSALGDVSASIAASRGEAEEKQISFTGFEPVYGIEDKPFYADVPQRTLSASSSYSGSYVSSFASSFTSSFSGSFSWEYEYESSFSGSFSGSFVSSLCGSFFGICVPVFGYGIDLI